MRQNLSMILVPCFPRDSLYNHTVPPCNREKIKASHVFIDVHAMIISVIDEFNVSLNSI